MKTYSNHITYLGHSGFLLETPEAYYLFDYIRGDVPELAEEKPLYIFASHFHEDHFQPMVFDEKFQRAARWVLSNDIRRHFRRFHPAWMEAYSDRICWAKERDHLEFPEFSLWCLHSTDEGVAFVISEKDQNIYFAGDLNWWYWPGEPDPWNPQMEKDYKREIDRLKDMRFTVAFVPLDPRLEEGYRYGLDYFLEKVKVSLVCPMHFWGQTEVIDRYRKESEIYRQMADEVELFDQYERR